MESYKGLLAVAAFTAACVWGLMQLNVGSMHTDPLWALGTSIAFITILVIDVWLFFAIAKDKPFRWE